MITNVRNKCIALMMSLALAFVITLLGAETAYAVPVTVDGLEYFADYNAKTATVGHWQDTSISGEIEIPSSISVDGTSFVVIGIETYAFENCSSLTSINIPSTVTLIKSYAFDGCSSLTSINIPSTVTRIGSCAFRGCSSLKSITVACSFDKAIFDNSYVIPGETGDTFTISGTQTTGTFEYIHDYGAWTKLNATQHQKVCEHDASHVVKENHKWDAGKVTKKATVNATGVKTFTCTTCKATKTEAIPKLKVSGTPVAKTTTKGKTSLTFGWAKIKNVDGYDIFFALCDHGDKKIACKKVKTIKGNKTFTWTKSGLKKGTAYKAYVKAYIMKNGKKSYVRTSPMMHAYTGGQTKNYTNVKSVTVNKAKVTLKKGKTFKIKGKVIKINKNKKLMPKEHAPTLRYMTSNKKIAIVSSSGKITAKGKGTCVIYVYAHNGISKQVKVTVK